LETEWGVRLRFEESGRYYGYVFCPLADESKLSTYKFPDLDAPGRFEEAQEQIRKHKEDHFIKAMGLATIHRRAWELRGYEQWLADLMLNSTFVEKLSDLILDFELEQVRRFAKIGVDIVTVGGDIAVSNNLVMPPDVWRKYFKHREAKLIEEGKKCGVNHFYYHSDGNIMPVLADLVEIGFTIIDPIQPECMDPQEVKRKYGDWITLHGAISSQQTLPFGSVHDVKTEVKQRIMTLGRRGGFILAPHTVQTDVPLENIIALYDTARQTPLPKE
jgi:uroporphyrinogen decarboxylase